MAVNQEFVQEITTIDNSTAALKKIKGLASRVTNTFSKLGSMAIKLNQALELAAKAQRVVGRAFDATVSKAISLEKNVAEITTLLDDAAGATRFFTDEILAMQARFGTDQADLAKSYYQALSSGATDAANSTELLTTAQKLAVGGVTSLTVATDGLTTVMNAYGLSADEAMEVSDALFIGMKAGKTTIGELSGSLGQAAALASATGVSFQELIGAVSAITTGGVETSQAVTQVRSAMVGLSKQTDELQTVLKNLGITSIQEAVNQKGLVGVLKQVISQTDGSTESLTKMFGRIEAVNAILALTSDEIGGKFTKIMGSMGDAAQKAGDTTEIAFRKIAQTTAFRLQVLEAQTQVRLTKIGNYFKDILVPAFESVMNAIYSLEKGAARISIAFDKVDFKAIARETKDLAVAFTALSSAIGLAFTPQIAASLVAFGTALKAFSISAAATVAPMLLLAGKVAAVAASILATTVAIDILIRNFNRLPALFDAASAALANWALRLQRTLIAAGGYFTEFLLSGAEKLNAWGIVSDETVSKLRKTMMLSGEAIRNISEDIDKADESVINLSKDIDMGFAGEIFKQAKGFLKGFNDELKKTDEVAKEAAKSVGSIQQETPQVADMTAAQREAAQRLSGPIGEVGSGISEMASDAATVFGGEFGATMTSVSESIMSMVSSTASSIIGMILKAPAILDAITGIINEITNWPKAMFEAVQNFTNSIASFISDFIPNLIQGAGDILNDLIITFADKIPDAISKLGEMIPEMFTKLAERLPDMAVKLGEALVKANPAVLAIKLWVNIIKGIPKFVSAFVKAMPAIVTGFVDGVVLAFKEIVNEVANAFGLGDIFNIGKIKEQVAEMGDSIARSASQLFEVVDMKAATRGLDVADRIRNAIGSSTTKAKNIFQKLWAALEGVWRWVRDKVLMPIWNFITEAWLWVWNKVISPIINIVREAWLWVWNEVIMKIFSIVTEAFNWVLENVILKIFSIVHEAFNWVLEDVILKIPEIVTAAWQWVLDKVINPMLDGLMAIWQWVDEKIIKPISSAITGAWNWVKENVLDKFTSALTSTWVWIKTKIIDPVFGGLTALLQKLLNGFNTVFTSFNGLFGSVGAIFDRAVKPLKDVLGGFKPKLDIPNIDFKIPEPSWLSKLAIKKPSWLPAKGGMVVGGSGSNLGQSISKAWKRSDAGKVVSSVAKSASGAVSSVRKRLGFEKGGSVPRGEYKNGVLFAQQGAIAQGTDIVDAQLTPGEFIVNRQSARNNLGLLSYINQSRGSVQPVQSPTNISVVINTKTDLSPQQIKSEVIPTLTKELRKMSNQGQWVISTSGLRS